MQDAAIAHERAACRIGDNGAERRNPVLQWHFCNLLLMSHGTLLNGWRFSLLDKKRWCEFAPPCDFHHVKITRDVVFADRARKKSGNGYVYPYGISLRPNTVCNLILGACGLFG
jgi:hypothetical protein